MIYKIEYSKIKNYFRKEKIKSILLGLFIFGISMVGAKIQCFLRHDPDNFKESFKLFCISFFIFSLIIVISYLYKNW